MPVPDCAVQVEDRTIYLADCPTHADLVCYTPERDATVAGMLASAREETDRLGDAARRCALRLEHTAGELRACSDAIRIARDIAAQAQAVAADAEPVLPGWAWTVAGLAAPVLGWAGASAAGLDGAARWGVTAGAGALAVGAAVAVEW